MGAPPAFEGYLIMTSKSVAKKSTVQIREGLEKQIERLAAHLSCTVSGLFYKAGHVYLSHFTTKERHKRIKEGLGRYFQSIRKKRGIPEIPSWLQAFMDRVSKTLDGQSKPVRKKRHQVRRPRAALAC